MLSGILFILALLSLGLLFGAVRRAQKRAEPADGDVQPAARRCYRGFLCYLAAAAGLLALLNLLIAVL